MATVSPRMELAGQDAARERVLELALDRPAQRPRAVDRVVALPREQRERGIGHLEADAVLSASRRSTWATSSPVISRSCDSSSGRKTMISSTRFRNSGRKCSRSWRRTDLGGALEGIGPGLGSLDQHGRADVAGHDDDGVLEVDRAPLRVGQAPVVEELEQDVEDVRVRLLDLVEEHDLVRPAPDRLGQLAALVVADVAGRGADQPRTANFSMYSLMSIRTIAPVVVEEELGQRPRQLRLPDAGRAQEDE